MKKTKEQERGELASSLYQELIGNEGLKRGLFIKNIDLLSKIYKQELYKDILGDENGEWAGFLGQVEVYYTRSEVWRWFKIKERLVDGFGFTLESLLDIPETRLENIADFQGAGKEKIDELLALAKTAS